MEKTIIQMIKEAATKLKGSKLKGLKNAQTIASLKQLAEALGLDNKEQAMLFVVIFDKSCSSKTSDIDDIANYLDCSSLDAIEYVPELNKLLEKGIVKQWWEKNENMMQRQYTMNNDVMVSIVEGKKMPKNIKRESKKELDKYNLCKITDRYVQDSDTDTKALFKEVDKLEKECSDKNFIKEVKSMVKDLKERTLFYEMCYDLISEGGSGKSGIKCTLSDMYDRIHDRIAELKLINSDKHPLIKAGLIERMNEEDMCLTNKGIDIFLGKDRSIFCKPYSNLNRYEFAKAIDDYIDKEYKVDEHFATHRLRDKIRTLENANPQLHFIEPLKRLVGDEMQRTVFYISCHNCAEDCSSRLTDVIKSIYPMGDRNDVVKQLKEEKHHLQTMGLVELKKTSSIFGDSTSIKPTDKGKELFFEEEAELYIEKMDNKELITCDKIAEKHLFFESALSEQLSLVSNSLQEDHYLQLCERLQNKSLPHGIAILLYGLPGTGKTESVMQMAKQTGRDIVHVDISQTKSCWFGESEKLIKKVFDNYKSTCKKSKKKPILLFNEADAIFSKRKDIGSGNVDQTENAMQNIILEEMENLDGILIATTNLTENLDKAFERRFLFKIRFDKPTLEAKTNIWRDKMPTLSETDATKLASSYDFSGGEIDNIVRKALMQEVISGEAPTIDDLQKLCSEEKIDKHNMRIGF
jgi:hypothetical protein